MPDVPPAHTLEELATPPPQSALGDLGLVMGGGGARAAYQVGFLRSLARRHPGFRAPYITGVSAGAINAALLAAAILANDDADVAAALDRFRQNQTSKILADNDPST